MPDWNDVLKEIQQTIATHGGQAQLHNQAAQGAIDTIRRKYLQALRDNTGRNVIAYYSGFLSKPDAPMLGITDEDKNGFMMAVHSIGGQERRRGLDLILHTPGGSIAATESLVDYLHKIFGNDIRAIVPQVAMSAGTMIACSCKEILRSRHSGRYGPTFLSQCENSIDWSKKFVEKQLEQVMFDGDPQATAKAKKIVRRLTDYRGNKTHARHIHFEELAEMGLKVSLIEDDQEFQDVVLTVHHCFMHSLMNTPTFKMIENHKGSAFVKQQVIQQMVMQAVPQRN